MKTLLTIAIASCMALPSPLRADDSAKLLGTWKLVSYETEFQDGRPRQAVFGANPRGYLVYTAEGRQMVLIEAEGRKPPASAEDRVALFNSMISWSGTYKLEGDRHVLKIDSALNPALVGAERLSTIKVEGDRLHALSPWSPSPVLPGAPMARGVTVWERMK